MLPFDLVILSSRRQKKQAMVRNVAFYKKSRTQSNDVEADLILTIWATCRGISKDALNDALFDAYLHKKGCNITPHRNDWEEVYLAKLDDFVQEELHAKLAKRASVCLAADGWGYRLRRKYVDITLSFVDDNWNLCLAHPDFDSS